MPISTPVRHPIPWIKGVFFWLTSPLFFKTIRKGTLFFGSTRIPTGFGEVHIGQSCMIGDNVFFGTNRGTVTRVGNNVSINQGSMIVCADCIEIGDNVAIAEYVSIRDSEHKFSLEKGVRDQGFNVASIKVGNNVWIGRGVYIGPGVSIGDGCIIGANSVVRAGNYPSGKLIAGTPAVIKKSL